METSTQMLEVAFSNNGNEICWADFFLFYSLIFFFFFFEVILRNALQRLSLMHVFLSNEGNEWLVL